MAKQQIPLGLIGIGLVGTVMGDRLMDHRFSVLGFDVDDSRRRHLVKIGGQAAASAREVFEECNGILLSLPNSDIVAEVLKDCQPAFRQGQIVIDTTTGDPDQVIGIAESLRERGVNYVEATIAGSSRQICMGDACLFVGGDEQSIAVIQPILQAVAGSNFPLGPVGSASRFKLVHNLVLGLNRAVLAEGLSFAEALGFSPETTLEILGQTPAASAVMDTKGPKMVCRDWQPEARLSQHQKDVRLILALAEKQKSPTPLCRVHRELLEHAERLGFGDADNSAIFEAYLAAAEDSADSG